VVVVKQFNYVSILLRKKDKGDNSNFLVDDPIELGTESLDGEMPNNPLYQLAEEHHLIDIDDSKIA
jgi:hypothetical protein